MMGRYLKQSRSAVEEPQDFAKYYDPYDLVYGDCQHRCTRCGSIGYEIFGHGIRWEEKINKRG